jgi:ribosomal protein S18 acetylase RimI-like enzyme
MRWVLERDEFDCDVLGLEIGRLTLSQAADVDVAESLGQAVDHASTFGLDHVVCRVPADRLDMVWALESCGFDLLDAGVTFSRVPTAQTHVGESDGLLIRDASEEDLAELIPVMVATPWGGRYDEDRSFDPAAVREMRARWLRNCQQGRAARMLVAEIDGHPAGYVACCLEHPGAVGVIELVGTAPEFRGRGVAARLLREAVAWYSGRSPLVTVRTHVSNEAACALYESAGFRFSALDLTYRLLVSRLPAAGSDDRSAQAEEVA